MSKEVKADLTELHNLVKSLKSNYVLRVGILGSKAKGTHDKDSGLTNAQLGTFHEFGSSDGKHPPRRSFLEDSLKFKLNFDSEAFKPFRKNLFKNMFIKKKPQEFLQDLGAKCLEIIEEGFATSGFGMWKQLSARQYQHKASKTTKRVTLKSLAFWDYHQILTDTGKLRRSITFKVVKTK